MMTRSIAVLLAFLFGATSVALAGAPTTLDDFTLPGSQPGESGTFRTVAGCDCHSGYNIAAEPVFTWEGSMMSQALRDPLFAATMVIANQDAPESGDLCIRCHTPKGWLEGRSTPTDGSALTADDRQSVTCHFCHKAIKPTPVGVNPYPGDAAYTSGTYPADQDYFSTMATIPSHSANGMYVVDSIDIRRGPYTDPSAPHDTYYSPFHKDAAMCGTCHDVSNPVYSKGVGGIYEPNSFGAPPPNASPYQLFPVERTYSEWLMSDYNTGAGVYAPQFGGNLDTVRTCQDCHMRDVTGAGCRKGNAPIRPDLGLHDMTGGNTFVPELIKQLFPGEVNAAALDSGVVRARRMLQLAASMELTASSQGGGFLADVKVTNETGHKLPSGYPEGRRIWINVRAYNTSNALIYESGAYDTATGVLTHDADVKIYEIKPGIGSNVAATLGLPAGPSFHFVLNNQVYSDNRIPPRGFTNANFQTIQSPPVAYSYADGQYWDHTSYPLPGSTARVEATLYYQTTSKEYIEFLRDENVTDTQGDDLYALWAASGKSRPVAMVSDTIFLSPTGDTDGDGIPDSLDNCPAIANPGQEDADNDGYGAVCDCNDTDSLINPATFWYADADSDTYGDPAVTLTQCDQPADYVLDSTDCNDTDSLINPATVWHADADSDTYGDPAVTLTQCDQPAGYVPDSTDCDDTDPDIHPDITVYRDADGDLYGDPDVSMLVCTPAAGWVLDNTDCDDANPAINPATVWYADADSDTYGDPAVTLTQCGQPTGYVLDSTDCDDTDPAIHPSTVWYEDMDGDGFGDAGVPLTQCEQPSGYVLDSTDCDDVLFSVHPGAAELCNGYDDNCDLTADEGLGDTDLDGWGAACDNCPDVFNPGQEDTDSNGIGDACEGTVCPITATGDVNETGSITSADVIYLVNYVFKAGASPLPCEAAGDVNCDGVVTSGDIIYAVNHVFKGGPAPCDVCTMIPGAWTCP